MKRPIKFRGRTLDGRIVFGDFVHYVPMSSFPGIVNEDGFVTEVDPDSVAQFLGYDINGLEVYEGDTLRTLRKVFSASFQDSPLFLEHCILKETYHEKEIPAPVED